MMAATKSWTILICALIFLIMIVCVLLGAGKICQRTGIFGDDCGVGKNTII